MRGFITGRERELIVRERVIERANREGESNREREG